MAEDLRCYIQRHIRYGDTERKIYHYLTREKKLNRDTARAMIKEVRQEYFGNE